MLGILTSPSRGVVGVDGDPRRSTATHLDAALRRARARAHARRLDVRGRERARHARRGGGQGAHVRLRLHAYGLLAAGHRDAVVEADLKPHDYMALVPIGTGAGGKFND